MEILKPLNLPSFDPKIRKGKDDKLSIFDPLRNKYVALTPEEWVRQHFIHFLIEHRGYPQTLLANEIAITLNGTTKRCDTVLFPALGTPAIIILFFIVFSTLQI